MIYSFLFLDEKNYLVFINGKYFKTVGNSKELKRIEKIIKEFYSINSFIEINTMDEKKFNEIFKTNIELINIWLCQILPTHKKVILSNVLLFKWICNTEKGITPPPKK